MVQIVLDTNVLVAGLRSNRGASFKLLELIGRSEAFEINLSVPLVLEYEAVLRRMVEFRYETDVDRVLNYLCQVGNHRQIFFLWRPFLRDASDEMVLEVAVESGSQRIVTHNVRDFERVPEQFGIEIVTPRAFLAEINEV